MESMMATEDGTDYPFHRMRERPPFDMPTSPGQRELSQGAFSRLTMLVLLPEEQAKLRRLSDATGKAECTLIGEWIRSVPEPE
jgi:hypothetical protein